MLRTLKAFVLVGGIFAGGLVAGSATVHTARAQVRDAYEGLNTLARAMHTIEVNYFEEVDHLALVHAAIRGMVDSLDPHSVWLDPEEYKALQERADGRYLGIGVELGPLGDLVVEGVLPRSPADIAGVQPGDRLLTIDGQPIAGLSREEILRKLEGPEGKPVVLGLLRGGQEIQVPVVREELLEVSVAAERLPGGVGYVRIEHFSRRTATETARAVGKLSAEGELAGLILDLRDNPGGLIEEAVALVDLFVGSGLIVRTEGRADEEETYNATASSGDIALPLAILVNGGSASASELSAGSLRDLGRAKLVGEPTYGKGSMQHVYEFEDGSALKLTVARYYLPSGATISPREGLQPDVLVPLKADPLAELQAEIAALPLSAEAREELSRKLEKLEYTADAPPPKWQGTAAERLAADPQLQAAFKALGGQP